MRTTKISEEQFTVDCINKAHEIANSPLRWNTFEELKAYAKEHHEWWDEIAFDTEDQYNSWREYFLAHFYDWQPKRVPKKVAKQNFSWFSLSYGPRYNFLDYNNLSSHD